MTATFKQDEVSIREELNTLSGINQQIARNRQEIRYVANFLTGHTGKNLIVNGDFSVWQRGDAFTINANSGIMTADGVLCWTAGSSIFPYKDHDGLVFQGQIGNTTVAFNMRIEANVSKHLIDKESILSIHINSFDTINDAVVHVYHANTLNDFSGVTSVATSTSLVPEGKSVISLSVPANTNFSNGLQVSLGFNDGVTGGYVTLENMQLELGNQVTVPEIVNPTDQFARCQRYYRKLGGLMGVFSTFAVPSVSVVGSPTGALIRNGLAALDITTVGINSDRGLIDVAVDTVNVIYQGHSLTLNGNIIALSAEL